MNGQQTTGKQRAIRIPLDYFKQPNPLERWKLWLSGIALLLAAGWIIAGLVQSDQGRSRYSRGPLAKVHAAWDTECSACHVSFSPINSSNPAHAMFGKSRASDQQCMNCHEGHEQQQHHKNEKAGEVPYCADCHRDHKGIDFSLVRVGDAYCTSCHANLQNHVAEGKAPYADVTVFAKRATGGHPEFKLQREKLGDPGKLKFNHSLHMSEGITPSGGKSFTLASITDAKERERYRQMQEKKDNDSAVKLDCTSCHRLDALDFKLGPNLAGLPTDVLMPPRSPGAYMLPIVYENQCKACHPLALPVSAEKATRESTMTVPHGKQPDEVREFLRLTYVERYLKDQPTLREELFRAPRTKPGDPPATTADDKAKVNAYIAEKVSVAEKILFGGKQTCAECHYYAGEAGQLLSDKLTIEDLTKIKKIVPTNVPAIWYTHASFSHASHRGVSCKGCHENAYPDGNSPSIAHTDILIPGIDNCIQCHAPASRWSGHAQGGVRFECTECHRYHHGDEPGPLQGIGAAARDAKKKLSIQQFLSGDPSRPETKLR